MKLSGNLKGIFSFEKKFNVNLLPKQLTNINRGDLITSTFLHIIAFTLYVTFVFNIIINDNFKSYISIASLSGIILYVIFSISSIIILSDEMKKFNKIYSFVCRNNEYYKLDRHYYDITEKQIITYTTETREKKIDKSNNGVIKVSEVVTEFLNNKDTYKIIKTKNENTYSNNKINVLPFVQIIVTIILLFLSFNHPKFYIIYIILGIVIPVYIGVSLSRNIKIYQEEDNINNIIETLNTEWEK